MAKTDLFTALDTLWTKVRLEKPPSMFIQHRFLASDPDYAQAAKVIQKDIKEPDIAIRTWQGILPRGAGSPRLSYLAPRKGKKIEELTQAMMANLRENRVTVEAMLEIYYLLGRTPELYQFHGLKPK